LLLIILILAAFVTTAHFLVGTSAPGNSHEADRRDALYFTIHAATLLAALLLGFALGKWLNGLGLALGMLCFVVVASILALGQVAAYEAACHGQNDIIRHWSC
jgi:hypothetical protein